MDSYRLSIDELHAAYAAGHLTVREVVLSAMERIAFKDQGPEGCNAVLEVNPDALFLADALDARLRLGEVPKRLFGIPVLLKDNINTADGMMTTAGSVALEGNFAPRDAHIVTRLRAADAILLGKANMTEFANFISEEPSNGYSSRGGQVYSPYNRQSDPSGSSTGSAVGVATGLAPLAVGTETGGSIISPAQEAGIVGIKPTIGLLSRTGILPISRTLDTAGPMARTVRDAARMLGEMAGMDAEDAQTGVLHGRERVDYTARLDEGALRGARIGVNRHAMEEIGEEHKRATERLLEAMRDAGAVLIDPLDFSFAKGAGTIMRHEFKRSLHMYLHALGDCAPMRSLQEIIAYNQAHKEIALKYGQATLLRAENAVSGRLIEREYAQALREREERTRQIDELFDENSLDGMLLFGFTNIAPFCGFPSMTIPIGRRADNVPIGSYWMGRKFGEEELIRIAYAAERMLNLPTDRAL